MTLFQDKYRIENIRRQNWDYSAPGLYFVTICTRQRRMYLGTIENFAAKLSAIGEFAQQEWQAIPGRFKNVNLDEFVIMPNHLHGVIKISGQWQPKLRRNDIGNRLSDVSPRSGSLSHIIRCYKGGVTYWCKQQGFGFGWQTGFHDRIIRGPKSLEAVPRIYSKEPIELGKGCRESGGIETVRSTVSTIKKSCLKQKT